MAGQALTDEDLARAASEGDRAAFADLYQRYFHGLYDFASRTLRDPTAAADVVQETFVKAWEQMRKGRVPDKVRAWIYVVARNAAIDEIRRRGREILDDAGVGDEDRAPSPLATIEAGPGFDPVEAARDRELVELTWQSAQALGPKDYTLLDLHVRRGLGADELAGELGMKKGAVWTALSRLRDSFEESVVTVLMMRRGRRDCERLAALLDEMGAEQPSREVRRAVQTHIEECEACDASRRAMVSPSRLLAGFAFVPVPEGLRQRLWDDVSARTQLKPRAPRRSRAMTAAALALVLGGAGAGVGAALDRPAKPPADPEVRAGQEIGGRMDGDTLRFSWDRRSDVAGYGVAVTGRPRDLPARRRNLPGDATGYATRVPAGTWYFHLRTEGRNGLWTSTVHLGPFERPDLPVSGRCNPMDSPPEWEGLVSTVTVDGRNATARITAGGAAADMVAEVSSFDFPVETTLAGTRLGAPQQIARSLTFRGRLDERPAPGRLRLDLGIAGVDHVFGSCSMRVPAPPPEPAHALETGGATPAATGGFPIGALAGGGLGFLLGFAVTPIVTRARADATAVDAAIDEGPCDWCKGSGKCRSCGGSGWIEGTCNGCFGKGNVEHPLGGTRVPCLTCYGVGKIGRRCGNCHGKGVCSFCGGTKKKGRRPSGAPSGSSGSRGATPGPDAPPAGGKPGGQVGGGTGSQPGSDSGTRPSGDGAGSAGGDAGTQTGGETPVEDRPAGDPSARGERERRLRDWRREHGGQEPPQDVIDRIDRETGYGR